MILWIFPWMIGASLVLGGYLHHRHAQQMLVLAQGILAVRLEGGLAIRTTAHHQPDSGAQ